MSGESPKLGLVPRPHPASPALGVVSAETGPVLPHDPTVDLAPPSSPTHCSVHPQVEKRLELVKQVSHSTHKKLTACLQGQQGAEADKRSVSALPPPALGGVKLACWSGRCLRIILQCGSRSHLPAPLNPA